MDFIGKTLQEEFSVYGYTPTTKKLKYCATKLAACRKKQLRPALRQWGKHVRCDNSKSKKVLHMEYRDLRSTIVEMAHSLINHVIFNPHHLENRR